MRTTDLPAIRSTAMSLLDKHNGGIGLGAPDEPDGPCGCEGCELARKWLARTL